MAGKSGGEFFTPADISELLTRLGTVGKTEINKVYDPACGSGSLLLKAEKVLGRDAVRNGFYGQEINITTYNLCRINMFLHDVGFDPRLCCHLCGADTGYRHKRRPHRRDMGLHGLFRAALLLPVQDWLHRPQRVQRTLKEG